MRAATAPQLGVRAHDFGRMPAGQLAQTIASHGLSCTQLAPSKAIAGLKSELGQLNSDMARRIGRAFQDNGVQIAVIGCYVNPIHPDHPTRRRLLDLFKEHLQYARDLSCGLVALESGSVRANYGPDPRNGGEEAFQESLASIAELVEEAEHWGITVGLEAVSSHVVSTPARMQRMLQSVASNNLQVVFDPVNLLSADNWREQERVIGEALDRFGDRIAVVHSKDFTIEGGQLVFTRTGQGWLQHSPVFEWLLREKPGLSVVLENVDAETVQQSRQYVQEVMTRSNDHE